QFERRSGCTAPRGAARLAEQAQGHDLEEEIARKIPALAPNTIWRNPRSFHRRPGEANIDSVQIGDEIAEHEERHEAPHHFGNGRLLDLCRHIGDDRKPGLSATIDNGVHLTGHEKPSRIAGSLLSFAVTGEV